MTDISQVRTVYDAKSLHRALADVFRDDELKRIPLLRRGQRLAQGSTYYDLCEGRELTALGTQVVGRDDCVVAKAEVGYDIWNRLRTLRVAPVDQDTGPMCDAVVLACTNCGVPIVDPVVQVVHNDRVFCCPNCAEAMEQTGSGAYPSTVKRERDPLCAHCGSPIVFRATMETRGDNVFCCSNCAQAAN